MPVFLFVAVAMAKSMSVTVFVSMFIGESCYAYFNEQLSGLGHGHGQIERASVMNTNSIENL
jgi:hypothetical protein